MLAEDFDAFLIDLDGVVYLGNQPLPGAIQALAELRARSKAIRFLTNDPRPHRVEVAARLTGYGIEATVDEVITSGWTAAQFARARGHRSALVIGSKGLAQELLDAGVAVVRDEAADVVIAGCDEYVAYRDLNAAVAAITHGAEFVATNRDTTYPVAPGVRAIATGTIVAAIEAGSGRRPTTVGKPMPPMFRAALKTLPARARVAVVGDGLRTDIEGARRTGLFAILVSDHTDTSQWGDVTTPHVVIGNLPDLFIEDAPPLAIPTVPITWPFAVEACVGAVVFNRAGEVLLQRRSDCNSWALPTGRVEPGESLQRAIEREVREETGMSIVVERLCGVYSDPSRQVFADASGWVMHTIMTVFVGRAEGAPAPDGVEVSEVRFFEVGQLPALPFGDEEWIRDALEARRTGKVALEYQGSQEPS